MCIVAIFLFPSSTLFSAARKPAAPFEGEEPWKGSPYPERFSLAISGGLGSLGGTNGFSLLGAVSYSILHKGFIDDINDQVQLEAQVGPYFQSGVTNYFYSIHMRWDLHKDYQWSFFAIGGLAGVSESSGFGNSIHLRFGTGIYWHLFEKFSFRLDVSREFLGLGASLAL